MINREKILQMIAGYGADLRCWPVTNQQEISEYIAADSELSLALSTAVSDELILTECFAASEPAWSLIAEKSLAEKISGSVTNIHETKKTVPWWQSFTQRLAKPAQVWKAFPAAVAMLLLIVVIQVFYKNEPIQIATYTTEEFQDWLVFEGINMSTEKEPNTELMVGHLNEELGELPEFIYYL